MLEKAPKMNKVEMVRSDVSGRLYPASECELVVIKIIKGKDEDVNDYFKKPEQVIIREVAETGKPATVVPGLDPKSPEFTKAVHRRTSIIPPAMRDIFGKPPELQ